MTTKFIIREETTEDTQDVFHIIKKAFVQSPRGYHGEAELVDKLRISEGYLPQLSLVADQDGQVIGHIILTRVYINDDGRKVPTLILAPVSVLPDYQNQGVGGALINEVHKVALELGENHVFLLGHVDYYPKFGYQPSRNFGIVFPEGRDDDHCMAIELVRGSLKSAQGALEYSQPFYDIG